MRRFFARLAAFFRRGRAEREMTREIAAHLALMEDDFRQRGMSAEAARLAALRVYGGVEQSKELHRDARSFVGLEQLLQDIRHAGRGLRKSPTFTAVALLSLAFGIGVNTAVFTLVNGILLKRLPVVEPERVVQIQAHLKQFDSTGFSYPTYTELRAHAEIFAGLIAFQPRVGLVDFGSDPRQTEYQVVTGSYFGLFGARPELGRLLDEEDDRVDGASPVCVISYRVWQARFGGDPAALNRTIRIGGVPLRVVGVAPRGFTGADLQRRDDVWVPTAMTSDLAYFQRESPHTVWLRIMGRLKPGLSLSEATARLEAASPAIEAALPKERANANAVYQLLDGSKGNDSWRSTLRDPLMMLMGAVTLVMLVACANLANLLLARAGERRQEFAIKLSLGISRGRLVRELLIEVLAIALTGGALALLLARALTRYLLDLFYSGNPWRQLDIAPDSSVLVYTLAACVATALLAGIYPAWQAARTDPAQRLAPASATRRGLMRRFLILVQVTVAVTLLFGATLFAHSLRKLKTIDLGFDLHRALSIEIADAGPRKNLKPVTGSPQLAEILERVRRLPAVESAAYSDPGVLSGGMMASDVKARDASGAERVVDNVFYMAAGSEFFSTLRMRLLKGRDFGPNDRAGAPAVAIVNERLASLAWPGEDPVGKHFPSWQGKDTEVVGVVGNSKYQRLREPTRAILYMPFDQMPVRGGTIQIRCRGDAGAIERDVRLIVKSAGAYQVNNAVSIELLRDGNISQERVLAFLSSLFGALGTTLALVGIYGLISFSVIRRTREVGIRMSIGAQRADVLWLFLRESLALVAAGIVLGLPLALLLARFAGKMLYGISTREPVDIVITLGCLALGGAIAAYVPGRRATKVDPVQALRYD